jgi:ABC-type lipoprotein export system ATPase subunit
MYCERLILNEKINQFDENTIIKFNKKNNLMIGANGAGKSQIMNLLYELISTDDQFQKKQKNAYAHMRYKYKNYCDITDFIGYDLLKKMYNNLTNDEKISEILIDIIGLKILGFKMNFINRLNSDGIYLSFGKCYLKYIDKEYNIDQNYDHLKDNESIIETPNCKLIELDIFNNYVLNYMINDLRNLFINDIHLLIFDNLRTYCSPEMLEQLFDIKTTELMNKKANCNLCKYVYKLINVRYIRNIDNTQNNTNDVIKSSINFTNHKKESSFAFANLDFENISKNSNMINSIIILKNNEIYCKVKEIYLKIMKKELIICSDDNHYIYNMYEKINTDDIVTNLDEILPINDLQEGKQLFIKKINDKIYYNKNILSTDFHNDIGGKKSICSSGEKELIIMITMLFSGNNNIILMDEPLINLAQNKIEKAMEELIDKNKQIFIITHDPKKIIYNLAENIIFYYYNICDLYEKKYGKNHNQQIKKIIVEKKIVFFSDNILLVEGFDDLRICSILKNNEMIKNYDLIELDGKDSIIPKLLNFMNIRYKIIYDLDKITNIGSSDLKKYIRENNNDLIISKQYENTNNYRYDEICKFRLQLMKNDIKIFFHQKKHVDIEGFVNFNNGQSFTKATDEIIKKSINSQKNINEPDGLLNFLKSD